MTDKKNLLLITEDFPYGVAEATFLPTEYESLKEAFNVTIGITNPEIFASKHEPLDTNIINLRDYSDIKECKAFGQELRTEIRSALSGAKGLGQRLARLRNILRYNDQLNKAYSRLDEVIEERNIDLIYSYWCFEETVASTRLKAKHPKLTVASRFHGYDLFQWRTGVAQWQCFRKEALPKLDKLIFVSKQGQEYLLSNWENVDKEKCLVSHIGTKANERIAYEDKDEFVLVSCSDMIPLKRIHLIIEALALLPAEIRIHWYHLGNGELEEELHGLAQERLDGRDNINYDFTGRLSFEELKKLYHRVKPTAFITSSSTEGLPISIVEAFSMGIPAIATNVGGICELVDDSTGTLMSDNPTTQQIADAIINFVHIDIKKRCTISDNAYDRWKIEHDSEANSKALAQSLRKICE